MQDFISIIIPCYNASDVIECCLDQIIQSTNKNYEIICVDDCSTDNTIEVIKNYKKVITIPLKKNQGAAVSRNVGVKKAKGNILLFIDSDVILNKNTIEMILLSFKKTKADSIVAIYSEKHPYKGIVSNYKNLHLRYTRLIMPERVHIFDGSCVAIKKEVFNAVGGFDENIRILAGEDWDLASKIYSYGYYIYLDKTISFIHRKEYKLLNLFKTDLRKAFGVIKLLLRTKKRKKGLIENRVTGSLPASMGLSIILIAALTPLLITVIFNIIFSLIGLILILLLIFLLNIKYFYYFVKQKGVIFSVFSFGIFILYNFALILGFTFGLADYYILNHKY